MSLFIYVILVSVAFFSSVAMNVAFLLKHRGPSIAMEVVLVAFLSFTAGTAVLASTWVPSLSRLF